MPEVILDRKLHKWTYFNKTFIENIHKVNMLFSFWMYILVNIHNREEYFKKRGNTTDMLQFILY